MSTKAYANTNGINRGLELAIIDSRRRGDGLIIDLEGGSKWYVVFDPEDIVII